VTLPPSPAGRLDALVVRQAARTPEAIALRDRSATVSYAELVARGRRLAHVLSQRGVRRGDLVAIRLERSIDQLVGVLGALLSGAAYVPISPYGPAARQRFMLKDSRPRAILTSAATLHSIPAEFAGIAITPESIAGARAEADNRPAPGESVGTPQDLAYVIYTSGSTGTPKGVENQHDGVVNHLAWMAEAFPLTADDRVLAKTPAVFDVSVWEWFWPLSQGASLVLARPGGEKDPSYLLATIESHAITNAHFVPTLLRLFLERPDLERCRSVQRIFCSGEALTSELRDRFFERLRGPALVNLYGPTETAVHVTGWTCTPGETGPVPIGRALPGVRAYIVDEWMNEVTPGVPGELLIGGVQVARGYLGRDELTRERFVPDPFNSELGARCYRTGDCVAWRDDGVIDFFGRFDAQVQLGGVRVEPGEIEAALRGHRSVSDAAVVLLDTHDASRLVAYLRRTKIDGREPDPAPEAVRRYLADKVPDYMVPGRFVWLDDFPVTATGKLDRRALPAPEAPPSSTEAFEPPRSATEVQLARIWSRELRLDRVGRHDDFYLLGGDSLAAVRLVEQIRTEFGLELPPGELLQSPTLASLAARVDAGATHEAVTNSVVTLQAANGCEALYLPPAMGGELLYWRDLARALGPGLSVYGFTLSAGNGHSTDLPALAAALVRDLVAFQPEGPYHLAGYSFSAALALEMAQQLRASGRQVGVVAMIDYGPGIPDHLISRTRTFGHFLANLPNWLRYDALETGARPLMARMGRKLGTLGGRIASVGQSDTKQTAQWVVDEIFDSTEIPAEHRRLAIEHLDAFYRYQPAAYDGHVLFFLARCRPLLHSLSPTLGWEHYAAGFTRVVVDCNHDNILMTPHVDVIATALDRAIRDSARPAPGQ